MVKLNEILRICLLAVANRYPDCVIEVNPFALKAAGLWKGACTAEQALHYVESHVPQLLQAPACLLIDQQQAACGIYLLACSQEVPAFQLFCGKDHCGLGGRHALHEPLLVHSEKVREQTPARDGREDDVAMTLVPRGILTSNGTK